MLENFLISLTDEQSPISRAIERWFWPVFTVAVIVFAIVVIHGLATGQTI